MLNTFHLWLYVPRTLLTLLRLNTLLSISNPLNATSFTGLISGIANWVFMIAIPLATLMFLIGGFMFMTSGGNDQRVTQAKKTMLWAAVGLAVCLIGAGFTSIIRQLLGAN